MVWCFEYRCSLIVVLCWCCFYPPIIFILMSWEILWVLQKIIPIFCNTNNVPSLSGQNLKSEKNNKQILLFILPKSKCRCRKEEEKLIFTSKMLQYLKLKDLTSKVQVPQNCTLVNPNTQHDASCKINKHIRSEICPESLSKGEYVIMSCLWKH